MTIQRRTLLKAGAAAGALATFGNIPVFALNPAKMLGTNIMNDDSILIIIQLFGGNDGLNTIIPADDPNYYAIRPNIAVKKDQAKRIFNSKVYFHPALVNNVYKNGFLGLIEEGRLAVIQGSGYEYPNLSHFRSTDIWLSGINSSEPDAKLSDGWLGRYFSSQLPNFPIEVPEHPLCIQLGGSLSMLFKSPKGDMGIALSSPDEFFKNGQGSSTGRDIIQGNTPYVEEYNFIQAIAKQSDTYSTVVKSAYDKGKNTLNYAAGFPAQMATIARLISGGLKTKVYMAYLGGFDTHVQQQNTDNSGLHPNLMASLANGISQFMADALSQGFANKVVGLTVSEFGRRPYENGSNGTDHGTTSVQFAFGNRVQANVFGNDPDLQNFDRNGDLDFDLQRNIDYRRVYAEILQTWFGATKEEVTEIFGERIVPLPYLQPPISYVADSFAGENNNKLRYSCNQSNGQNGHVHFELKIPATLEVNIYDIIGKYSTTVYNSAAIPGHYAIPLQTESLQNGTYICEVLADQNREILTFSIVH
jgi:uncharacterized protein (DUF1501 family)